MKMQRQTEQDDVEKLIARWERIHRDVKIIPAVWGTLYLAVALPFALALMKADQHSSSIMSAVIVMLSVILTCIVGGTFSVWLIGSRWLLPKLLRYDDIRIVPCLIQAAKSPHHKYHPTVIERLTHYFGMMTVSDAALLTEKEYNILHSCLSDSPDFAFDKKYLTAPFRLAILQVLEEMANTRSIPTLQKILDHDPNNVYSTLQMKEAIQKCLNALREIQEHAKHNTTLLRASQQAATPETLLRAAMPCTPNDSNLLTPTENPLYSEKNEI